MKNALDPTGSKGIIRIQCDDTNITWKFPTLQVALIVIFTLLMTVISVIGPLKRIKQQGITQVIGSL